MTDATPHRVAVDDGDLQLYHGDVCTVLRSLPAGVAQTCVTSPPYWGLRDYGTGQWEGGDAHCDHAQRPARGDAGRPATMVPRGAGGAMVPSGSSEPVPPMIAYRDVCGRCGARRVDQQLGLEASPGLYVERMVAVFREVWRVLRDDGTLWLNIGDSYAQGHGGSSTEGRGITIGKQSRADSQPRKRDDVDVSSWSTRDHSPRNVTPGLKPKDLVGIPWRVAFALQADGWYLRSDVIWSKPNPMPESVSDRPTKAHEYVFLFSKRPRYVYDADAVREPAEYGRRNWSDTAGNMAGVGMNGARGHATVSGGDPSAGRNLRSVWEIATEPFPDAHFATYPQALVERCVKAGSREGDTVIDPFVGSGTTALVSRRLGRRCIGIDLSVEYLEIAKRRTQQLSLLGGAA